MAWIDGLPIKKRVDLSMARQKSPDGRHGKFPGNFNLIKLGDQTLRYEGTQKFGRLDMCETIQWSSPAPPKKPEESSLESSSGRQVGG